MTLMCQRCVSKITLSNFFRSVDIREIRRIRTLPFPSFDCNENKQQENINLTQIENQCSNFEKSTHVSTYVVHRIYRY